MGIKKKCAVLACALSTSLMASSVVRAEDVKGSLSILYSPHTTNLSAPGYLQHYGQLPIDHENKGNGYYGFQGEVGYGRYSLSVDYLTGTSNTIAGAADFASPTTFNPLTYETSEVIDLRAGYSIIESGPIGTLDATLGYFRMWASPTISPPNWYDGLELGLRGRFRVHDSFTFTCELGYVPNVSVHGYMKDANLMKGRYLVNYMIGGEVPVGKDISIIGGYKGLRAVNKVVVDGSEAIVKFTGFYVGGAYNF